MRLASRPAPRPGLSLLEVLAALAIFLMSFVAIGKLVTVSTDHALDVEMQSQATQLAQSKLHEVIAGALPLNSQSGNVDEDPDWQWSIDAEQNGDVSSVWTIKVRVWRQLEGHEIESTLSQMVLDPSVRGGMFDQLVVTGSQDTAPASSSSSSSPSSGQQTDPSAGAGAVGGGAAGAGTKGGGTKGGGTMGNTKGGGTTGGTTGTKGGGTTGGNTGGRVGGTTGGNTGGNTGGRSGGTTGGNSSGNTGGRSGGASGGGAAGKGG